MKRVRLNLNSKMTIILIILVLFIFLILTYLSLKNFKINLNKFFLDKANATAYSLENNINTKEDINRGNLLLVIQKQIWLDPDIIGIDFNFLRNEKLLTFASDDSNKINQEADADNLISLREDKIITNFINDGGNKFLKIISPIHLSGLIIGTVELDFTTEMVDQKIKEMLWQLFFNYMILTVFSLVIFYIVNKNIIIDPIKKLNAGIESLGQGNLNQKLIVSSRDELGNLTMGFNNMAVRLKETYDHLKKEEARLMASINSLTLGFMIADLNGNSIIVNPALKKIFDFNEESISVKIISEKLKGGLSLENEFIKMLKEKKSLDIKDVLFGSKYLRIIMAPVLILHDHNEIIGGIILFEDITEQKILEESKSNFMAIASHEMRTPLTIIRGNSELISQMIKSGKEINGNSIQNFISSIYNNSVRLLGILHDFIDTIFLEEKRIENKSETFDLSELANELILDFQKMADEKNISLKLKNESPDSLIVLANKDRVRQIIVNLVGNAIQYTEKGRVEIILKENGNFAEILISDTGIGIAPENQVFLFKKFSTINKAFLQSKNYGSGLGLYISKLLVESMGGKIKLEKSELGVGSVFSINLPRVKKDVENTLK